MKKRNRTGSAVLLAAAGVLLLLAGCSRQPEQDKKETEAALKPAVPILLAEPEEMPAPPDRMEQWDEWRTYLEENQVPAEFLEEVSHFSYETAQELMMARETNLIYSPLSLYYALSLAAAGTSGETADELYGFLSASDPEQQPDYAGKLYRQLYEDSQVSRLMSAASLWVSPEFTLSDGFLQTAREDFLASVYSADFGSGETAKAMGEWVAEKTDGTLAPNLQVTADQRMSLLNTVYLTDEWMDRFTEEETADGIFYGADGSEQTVPFMKKDFFFHGFSRGENYLRTMLELKENGTMYFVLPDENVSVDQLLASPEALCEAFEGGEELAGEVYFEVPRFSADSSPDIRKMMEQLGVKKIFEDGDFSAMTDEKDIVISDVRQDAHIGINEKGVEASAFTDISYAGCGMPQERAEMILNRPFLYGIMKNGVWLFMGVCDMPEA